MQLEVQLQLRYTHMSLLLLLLLLLLLPPPPAPLLQLLLLSSLLCTPLGSAARKPAVIATAAAGCRKQLMIRLHQPTNRLRAMTHCSTCCTTLHHQTG
jgi:hypothetical protein